VSEPPPPKSFRGLSLILGPESHKLHRYTLAVMALGITGLFLWMIQEFLMALMLAALLSGVFHPVFGKLKVFMGGRRALASATTVLLVSALVIVPLVGFSALLTTQALDLTESARPWIETQLRDRSQLSDRLMNTRFGHILEPYKDELLQRLAGLAGAAGSWIASALSSLAQGTLSFVFMLFVMLYAQFFFLKDGKATLYKILYYLPLPADDEDRMLDKFVSVTRATIKGTLVIGALQGALGGIGLGMVGVEGAVVWGTIMAVLSVLPGIGPALVWFPVVSYLLLVGRITEGLVLLAWCALVVGSVDNLLRPRLVGRDTQMSDLMVLLSTLGGIVLFGAAGIIVGPIVGAMFITIWDLYGLEFRDVLPKPGITQSVLPGPVVPPNPWARRAATTRMSKGSVSMGYAAVERQSAETPSAEREPEAPKPQDPQSEAKSRDPLPPR
jgi:predicted PurR-regulated permease PerM